MQDLLCARQVEMKGVHLLTLEMVLLRPSRKCHLSYSLPMARSSDFGWSLDCSGKADPAPELLTRDESAQALGQSSAPQPQRKPAPPQPLQESQPQPRPWRGLEGDVCAVCWF